MQQDKNLELFSTKIFVFKFTNKEIEPLINEVLLKKEEKRITMAMNFRPSYFEGRGEY